MVIDSGRAVVTARAVSGFLNDRFGGVADGWWTHTSYRPPAYGCGPRPRRRALCVPDERRNSSRGARPPRSVLRTRTTIRSHRAPHAAHITRMPPIRISSGGGGTETDDAVTEPRLLPESRQEVVGCRLRLRLAGSRGLRWASAPPPRPLGQPIPRAGAVGVQRLKCWSAPRARPSQVLRGCRAVAACRAWPRVECQWTAAIVTRTIVDRSIAVTRLSPPPPRTLPARTMPRAAERRARPSACSARVWERMARSKAWAASAGSLRVGGGRSGRWRRGARKPPTGGRPRSEANSSPACPLRWHVRSRSWWAGTATSRGTAGSAAVRSSRRPWGRTCSHQAERPQHAVPGGGRFGRPEDVADAARSASDLAVRVVPLRAQPDVLQMGGRHLTCDSLLRKHAGQRRGRCEANRAQMRWC